MTGLDARRQAYDALRDIENKGSFANLRLKKTQLDDERDARLTTQLIYGTLQWQIYLDYCLQGYIRAKKVHPGVRTLLRMGAYQILKMDRVPDSAACNSCVELAKAVGLGRLSGFVNGVLRNLSRTKDSILLPDEKKQPTLRLSVEFGWPLWLVEYFIGALGLEEASGLLRHQMDYGEVCIKPNRLKVSPAQWDSWCADQAERLRPAPLAGDGYYWKGVPAQEPAFNEGWFTVQGEASQLAARLVEARPGQKILDLCAAPGGKSCAMAMEAQGKALITACDLHGHRVQLIEKNAHRLRVALETLQWDASQPRPAWNDGFDAVLVDAPCSGLGLLWEKPDLRHRVVAQDIAALAKLQRDILHCAARYVRPSGRLVYATCTMTHEENTEQVRDFLSSHTDYEQDDFSPLLPSGLKARVADGGLQLYPHVDGTAGFYMARFRRKER
ncbi:16S rRNA (cytosine(967)-C(5))-methyltransferase RsmB [Christensenellaceae bacterium NSJ-44]|uniref:16S rRNA (cytosine(967)-C(5))-methyltransferase n=1 Tax=Luoshenia tenuis TaxID=2763654 RepID=A0A926D1W3_9FIRM|nr:16S rRNA (cytosine(967)-C(5))-methyltransferase RsmB [Luoshenia tenuis]MBC8528795.1 16S rRNA (cytosine(967)-C(5))-methyltransferase RsmB [Luoshenia tenuis]